MANKKISQLAGTVPNEIVSGSYLFASAAGNVGVGYETKKITAQQIAEYVFTGAEGNLGFPATQLSGTKDVYLNNSNWVNSTATQPPNYGFLMLRTSDGLLTTGSGIGTPVDGDNLGDHTATQALNMANNDINNVDDIRFYQSAHSIIAKGVGNNDNLHVKAGNELALEGTTHVRISGLGLDLATIPISGNVTVTGGNLEIDPANKLIANEITITKDPGISSGVLSIEGASYHITNAGPTNGGDIFWDYSNIQYCVCNNGSNATYDFNGVADGQTVTLYIQNPAATAMTPSFTHTEAVPVVWGSEIRDGSAYSNSPPILAPKKTNIYTFVRINTGIFASAVTGYVY
tara:strand:+ start:2615 stop:3652 length:1038 start_codon:yes stop_codon:yes gene_type:complete